MLDFLEWLINYPKCRRGIGIGRTIAPKSGVPAEVDHATPPYYMCSTFGKEAYTGRREL
jgi:hypothetical protein